MLGAGFVAEEGVGSGAAKPTCFRGHPMATFITTIKFTPQGIKEIHGTTKRAAALKASAKKLGVKVTDIFWTLGPFDGLLIFEAPDELTATALMLSLGSLGNI